MSTSTWAQVDYKSLSEQFDQEVPGIMAEHNVPGAFIAVVNDNEVLYKEHFGFSDKENKVPVDGQTGFNIGSISKTITSWGVMRLVEQGKIGLDSSANNYLNRWQLPESKYDASLITIRSLLSHTAGLSVHGYYGWDKVEKLPKLIESLNGKPKKYTKVELVVEPNTKFQYSGGGYSVLQLVIEEVTGDTFEHYMDTAVMAPIGMNNSSFTIDDEILSRSSLEYNRKGREIPFEYFTEKAAAGFQTTPDDMVKFVQLNLSTLNQSQSESNLISLSSMEEMLTVVPASAATVPNGLGYRKNSTYNTWWHGGVNAGWWALIGINPENNSGLIMLTNSASARALEQFAFEEWNKQLNQ